MSVTARARLCGPYAISRISVAAISRILAVFALVVVMISGMAWCQGVHSAAFPVTITDSTGQAVTISSIPRRIISIAPSNTEILYALGVGDRVVGVTTACDYPPEVRQKEKVGDVNLNFEKIISLRPDLIVGVVSLQKPAIERLRKMGAKVVAVDPGTVDEVLDSIEILGRATGADPAKVESLVGVLRARKGRVAAAASKVSGRERPRVFVEIWHEPLMTAGPGTFIDEIIRLAGGENIASDSGSSWPQFSEEVLIQRDPQIIILTCHNLEQVMARASWHGISAIRNRRVYEINPDILVRPGPRLVDGLEQVAEYIRSVAKESR